MYMGYYAQLWASSVMFIKLLFGNLALCVFLKRSVIVSVGNRQHSLWPVGPVVNWVIFTVRIVCLDNALVFSSAPEVRSIIMCDKSSFLFSCQYCYFFSWFLSWFDFGGGCLVVKRQFRLLFGILLAVDTISCLCWECLSCTVFFVCRWFLSQVYIA